MKKTKEWLILNAVKAWLHNYDDGTQDDLTPQYQEFASSLVRDCDKSNFNLSIFALCFADRSACGLLRPLSFRWTSPFLNGSIL